MDYDILARSACEGPQNRAYNLDRRSRPSRMILTEQELRTLTGKKRRSAQARALDFMAIPYKPRPDGTLVVFRASVMPGTETGPGGARLPVPEPVLQP